MKRTWFCVVTLLAWLGLFFVLLTSAPASATEIFVTALRSRDPLAAPPANFATDTLLNRSPYNGWVSYILNARTDDGLRITGFDVDLKGRFLQRWNIAEGEFGPETSPTPNLSGTTNGDSHLLAGANPPVAIPLSEDNNLNVVIPNALPPLDNATRDYGIGSYLRGAWGLISSVQGESLNFAYIVIPRGSEATIDLGLQVGLSNRDFAIFDGQVLFVPEPGSMMLVSLMLSVVFIRSRLLKLNQA
jgi:hypothetical protein